MIRINLATLKSPRQMEEGQSSPSGLVDITSLKNAAAIRVGLFLLFPMSLYVYENFLLPNKKKEVYQNQVVLNELKGKNAQLPQIKEQIEAEKKSKETLTKEVASLRSVKKARIWSLLVMDMIQRKIPQNVWLSQLNVKESCMTLVGSSTTDSGVSSFLERLNQSNLFKEVNLVKSSEIQMPQGLVKTFELSGNFNI